MEKILKNLSVIGIMLALTGCILEIISTSFWMEMIAFLAVGMMVATVTLTCLSAYTEDGGWIVAIGSIVLLSYAIKHFLLPVTLSSYEWIYIPIIIVSLIPYVAAYGIGLFLKKRF